MAINVSQSGLKRTPLHDLHLAMEARMAPFAGYELPIQYPLGVLKEHLHTRAAAGLFDVSHMGQIALRPRQGNLADVAFGLERLVPVDVIAHCGDHLFLVVNASRRAADEAHLRAALSPICAVEVLENRALLALQGPAAEGVLIHLAPDIAAMRFMDVRVLTIAGSECLVTRSGYTGEDGFEISISAADAEKLARRLLENPSVALVGLGARDSLRTEAGLCLYGSDIAENTTPVEAALEWAMPKVRRRSGARCGGFPGAEVVLQQFDKGPAKRRVGLRSQTRAPIRAGALLFAASSDSDPIGTVTSGGFGPSLGGPVAMGYVPLAFAAHDAQLFAQVRGNSVPVEVADLPFVPHRYKRR